MQINTKNHTRKRIGTFSQLKMIQYFYNVTNAVFLNNDVVHNKPVNKEIKLIIFLPIIPGRYHSRKFTPLKYIIAHM